MSVGMTSRPLTFARVVRLTRLIGGGARYMIASRRMWNGPKQAVRYFCAAHGLLGAPDERFGLQVGGIHVVARANDWCAFEEILLDDEYGFIDEILRDETRPRVFDLGANIGLFAVRTFLVRPQAYVISVEAGAATFQVLQENCRANERLMWKPVRFALWEREGMVAFEESALSTASRIDERSPVCVPSITLERLVADFGPVHLAKMDIEGAEEAVLSQGESALDAIGGLIVEIHPNRCSVEGVVSILKRRFDYLYAVPGRKSSKPLVVAVRRRLSLPAFRM